MKTTDVIGEALTHCLSGDHSFCEALLKNDDFWEQHEAAMEAEGKRGKAAKIAAAKAAREKRWLTIPAEYRELFIPEKSCLPKDTVQYCRNWKPDATKGIGLTGDSGCGKTRLLVAVLRNLECTWLYLPTTRLAESVRRQYDDDFGIANRAFETLRLAREVKVLMLDDLGMESATNAVTEELAALIELRVHGRKPILWTSNRSDQELARHYGERGRAIVRRLAEFSWLP